MKKFESIRNITRYKRGFLFSKANFSLNVIKKRAATHLLKNHVEATIVFEPFNQLYLKWKNEGNDLENDKKFRLKMWELGPRL